MVKFNPKLKQQLQSFFDHVIIVEGKKDITALTALGFERVYAIHETGISIRERVEQIAEELTKKDKVCILTDFDKKGKQLYLLLKKEFNEIGVKLDSTLRGILLKARISHIEGLYDFMEKAGAL